MSRERFCAYEEDMFPAEQFGDMNGVIIHKVRPYHTIAGDEVPGAEGSEGPAPVRGPLGRREDDF